MNTCDSCKWWDVANDLANCSSHAGVCGNPRSQSSEDAGKGKDFQEDWLDVPYDFETGTIPALLTGPKFGCIHHEPQ